MLGGASKKLVTRVQYCGGCVWMVVLIESDGGETLFKWARRHTATCLLALTRPQIHQPIHIPTAYTRR